MIAQYDYVIIFRLFPHPTNSFNDFNDSTHVLEDEYRVLSQFPRVTVNGRRTASSVYQCVGHNSGQVFAVKRVAFTSLSDAESFARGLASWLGVADAHIASIGTPFLDHSIDPQNGNRITPLPVVCIKMAFVPGRSLDEMLNARADLAKHTVVDWFLQLLTAVEYLHRRHLVHCDIKPSNVIICIDPAQPPAPNDEPRLSVKLVDFALASTYPLAVFRARTRGDDMPWAAPELLADSAAAALGAAANSLVTSAVDYFALGVVLYEMLTHDDSFRVRGTGGMAGLLCAADGSAAVFERIEDRSLRGVLKRLLTIEPTARTAACKDVREWLDLWPWLLSTAQLSDSDRSSSSTSKHNNAVSALSGCSPAVTYQALRFCEMWRENNSMRDLLCAPWVLPHLVALVGEPKRRATKASLAPNIYGALLGHGNSTGGHDGNFAYDSDVVTDKAIRLLCSLLNSYSHNALAARALMSHERVWPLLMNLSTKTHGGGSESTVLARTIAYLLDTCANGTLLRTYGVEHIARSRVLARDRIGADLLERVPTLTPSADLDNVINCLLETWLAARSSSSCTSATSFLVHHTDGHRVVVPATRMLWNEVLRAAIDECVVTLSTTNVPSTGAELQQKRDAESECLRFINALPLLVSNLMPLMELFARNRACMASTCGAATAMPVWLTIRCDTCSKRYGSVIVCLRCRHRCHKMHEVAIDYQRQWKPCTCSISGSCSAALPYEPSTLPFVPSGSIGGGGGGGDLWAESLPVPPAFAPGYAAVDTNQRAITFFGKMFHPRACAVVNVDGFRWHGVSGRSGSAGFGGIEGGGGTVRYVEFELIGADAAAVAIGLAEAHDARAQSAGISLERAQHDHVGSQPTDIAVYSETGALRGGGCDTFTSFMPQFATGDTVGVGVVGVASAASIGRVFFTLNGNLIGFVSRERFTVSRGQVLYFTVSSSAAARVEWRTEPPFRYGAFNNDKNDNWPTPNAINRDALTVLRDAGVARLCGVARGADDALFCVMQAAAIVGVDMKLSAEASDSLRSKASVSIRQLFGNASVATPGTAVVAAVSDDNADDDQGVRVLYDPPTAHQNLIGVSSSSPPVSAPVRIPVRASSTSSAAAASSSPLSSSPSNIGSASRVAMAAALRENNKAAVDAGETDIVRDALAQARYEESVQLTQEILQLEQSIAKTRTKLKKKDK